MSRHYGQHKVWESDSTGEIVVHIDQVEPPNWVAMPWDDFLTMVSDYHEFVPEKPDSNLPSMKSKG
jgi:hypothetical protein